MDEKALPSSGGGGLIKQNDTERALSKLRQLGQQNSAERAERAKEAELIHEQDCFARDFALLVQRHFSVKPPQVMEMPQEEIAAIADVLYKKAWRGTFLQKIFTYGVPVIGWMFGPIHRNAGDFVSWRYRYLYTRLRARYGEDWFPHERYAAYCGKYTWG